MKYAIIIPDGAADVPLEALEGRTPFQAADKPATDALSIEGRQGTAATTPAGYTAGSDLCCLSLLGYDPVRYHPGRAPLEATAMGVELDDGDWILRCNLVTVIDGNMADHSAGHIGSTEGAQLLEDLAAFLSAEGEAEGLTFHPGVSYRNLLLDRSGTDYGAMTATPPHDIPGKPIARHQPKGGPGAARAKRIMQRSAEFFASHEINQTRTELGEALVSMAWLWGAGQKPNIPSFEQVYGLRGAMITAVDLLAGLAKLIGWDRLDVPNITGYHDTDYAAKGRYACKAMDAYDVVCVHIEAPDEASHQADAATKIASIEAIDRHIVRPVVEKLRTCKDGWRMLYLPDHYTRCDTRQHDATPVPFAMCGQGIHAVRKMPFSEENSNASDLHIAFGHELMEFFLRGGL